jgi:hypothetical protein
VTGFYAARLALLAGLIVLVGVVLVTLARVRERTVLAHAEPWERGRVARPTGST